MEQRGHQKEASVNYAMKLFSAAAILLVVVGHISSAGFNGPFDMFEPYSFQVAAFVFAAGYFYKERIEADASAFLSYCVQRFKRLIVPLLAINLIYGCFVAALHEFTDITWGASLSLQSLLVDPFTNGHQFVINMPMWFIAPLFFGQIMNASIRFGLRKAPMPGG